MEERGSIGIDIGSTTFKVVVLSKKREILFSKVMPTEKNISMQIQNIMENEIKEFISRDFVVVSTGYGKEMVKNAKSRYTEITCHLKGVFEEFKIACTIVDIGGQDSKVIKCNDKGELIDFVMNDKCSAGTGRFLENIALRFKLDISEIGNIALDTEKFQSISSTCTVFAESEIISLLAQGIDVGEILKGLHISLIRRIKSMIKSIGFIPPIILSGGVSLNPAIKTLIQDELKTETLISSHPQLTAALGAALLGL